MREIELPPSAPSLMESMRSVGYSLESALADLIDNTISARAKQVDIEFRPFDDPYIAVIDDGEGMLPDELDAAMRHGSRSPLEIRQEHDLGRYGLGLKTASLSQCKQLTVITVKNGVASARCWDMDLVNQRSSWTVLVPDESELTEFPHVGEILAKGHGTIVLWKKLDRLLAGESSIENALGQKMAHARDHLAQVFHRYINGETGLRKIAISINRNPLDAIDPFLTDVTSTQRLDEDRFFVESKQVTVKPFILPHISKLTAEQMHRAGGQEGLRSHQGFYVYRNRRLIIWGTWFRLARKDELSKLARVRVDIPNSLDHLWTLDIKKSVAHPPEAVRTNLRRTVERIAERSRRTYTFRGRVSVRDDLIHGWSRIQSRDGLRYDINREHPAILAVEKKLDEQGKTLFNAMLEIVERSFPSDSLYADMASDHKVTHEKDGPEGSLLELARQLVSCLPAGSAAQRSLVASLNTLEPFCHDPDIVKTITEELKDVS